VETSQSRAIPSEDAETTSLKIIVNMVESWKKSFPFLGLFEREDYENVVAFFKNVLK